jgi:hypothetical protein
MDGAFRGRRHRVEAEQPAGRHHDASAVRLGEIDQLRARQQRAAAEHHHLLAGGEHRHADVGDQRGRRALDREVGVRRHVGKRDHRAVDLLRLKPSLRLAGIARGNGGERHAGHAVVEGARQRAADGAEAGDGDAGRGHGRASGSSGAYHSARRSAATTASYGTGPDSSPRSWAKRFTAATVCGEIAAS